jgi:hypothetical protein
MQDYAGETKGDPAIAEQRAAALYELLENTRWEQESREALPSEVGAAEATVTEAVEAEAEAEIAEILEMMESYEAEAE